MPTERAAWTKLFSEVMARTVGANEWESMVEPLRQHERVDRPVLTILGPYDSGKSTLLKRLIVDDHQEVPAWVTVSGRRETFEVHTIDLSWARLRDTPGLAGGNDEHDRTAAESIALTDALLLVLPPQLLTGERDSIASLLSGRRFTSIKALPHSTEALLVAVARMDEAGTDPSENLAGYRELCQRKLKELQEQCARAEVALDAPSVSFVAADPYQQVSNRQDASPTDFDEFRPWDGIRELQAKLAGLATRLPALREAAAVRFLAMHGSTALQELLQRRQGIERTQAECKNDRERVALLKKQHQALLSAARADLEAVVNDQLRASALEGLGSPEEVAKWLEPRMMKAFQNWEARHGAVLEKFGRDAEIEVAKRSDRPGNKNLREFFTAASQARESSATKRKAPPIGKLGESLRKALKHYHEQKLGMRLRSAEGELKKLAEFSTFDAYRAARRSKNAFQSAEKAAQAQKAVSLHRGLELAGPLLVELGGLLLSEVARRQAVQERSDRRAALQAELAETSTQIAEGFWAGFEQLAGEYGAWLEEQDASLKALQQALENEAVNLLERTSELGACLRDAPGGDERSAA